MSTILQKIERKKQRLERDLPHKIANSGKITPNLLSIQTSITGQQIMIRLKGLVTTEVLETIQDGGFRIRSIAARNSSIWLLAEVK